MRQYRTDYDELKKRFMRCEENYLDQKNKETLMGSRIEVKFL